MPTTSQKLNRLLLLQYRLLQGDVVNKKDFAAKQGTTEKTVQRDISFLNCFYAGCSELIDEGISAEYSREKQGFFLNGKNAGKLNKEEILATAKILLESRAFCKNELDTLIDALLLQTEKQSQKEIQDVIRDEKFSYVPLHHNKPLLHLLYQSCECIRNYRKIRLFYTKKTGEAVERVLRPVSVIFSEYYFYLIAFRDDEEYKTPTIYRLDRIDKAEQTPETFFIPYKERFRDGEFRKRVQFMYSGELTKVTFTFTGETIEPVLERLPTAKVIDQDGNIYTIEAEVFGTGIKMWLLSQGSRVKVLGPESLAQEMRDEVMRMAEEYYDK